MAPTLLLLGEHMLHGTAWHCMEMAWLRHEYILHTVWELQGELSAVLGTAWALRGHCSQHCKALCWALHENCARHCMGTAFGTAWALCGPYMALCWTIFEHCMGTALYGCCTVHFMGTVLSTALGTVTPRGYCMGTALDIVWAFH